MRRQNKESQEGEALFEHAQFFRGAQHSGQNSFDIVFGAKVLVKGLVEVNQEHALTGDQPVVQVEIGVEDSQEIELVKDLCHGPEVGCGYLLLGQGSRSRFKAAVEKVEAQTREPGRLHGPAHRFYGIHPRPVDPLVNGEFPFGPGSRSKAAGQDLATQTAMAVLAFQ